MITRLGYTSSQTLLYNSPAGAIQLVAIGIGVIACKFFPGKRCLIIAGLICIPICGNVMLPTLPFQGWPIIAGSWLVSSRKSVNSLIVRGRRGCDNFEDKTFRYTTRATIVILLSTLWGQHRIKAWRRQAAGVGSLNLDPRIRGEKSGTRGCMSYTASVFSYSLEACRSVPDSAEIIVPIHYPRVQSEPHTVPIPHTNSHSSAYL